MIFNAPVPQHHLFKGSIPKKVTLKRPFVLERGKQEVFEAYTVDFENYSIEIWTDGSNFWINKE